MSKNGRRPRRTLSGAFFVIPKCLASTRAVVLTFTANKQTIKLNYTEKLAGPSTKFLRKRSDAIPLPTNYQKRCGARSAPFWRKRFGLLKESRQEPEVEGRRVKMAVDREGRPEISRYPPESTKTANFNPRRTLFGSFFGTSRIVV